MDMTYKILWIDDAEDYVDSTKELVVQAIQNRFMQTLKAIATMMSSKVKS